jgi:hypothetical protein
MSCINLTFTKEIISMTLSRQHPSWHTISMPVSIGTLGLCLGFSQQERSDYSISPFVSGVKI